MSLFIKNIFLVQLCLILAILYPTSLANLVVEVGTRHSHQTLLSTGRAQWLLNVNSLAPGSNLSYRVAWILAVKLLTGECHRTSLMRSHYWFQAWCSKQQASTWANADPDLRRYMASLSHSELTGVTHQSENTVWYRGPRSAGTMYWGYNEE